MAGWCRDVLVLVRLLPALLGVASAYAAPATLTLRPMRGLPPCQGRPSASTTAGRAWPWLSAFWSIDSSASLRELERDALYVAAFVGALGLLRFGGKAAVAAGVALGATALAGYSLVEFVAGRGRTALSAKPTLPASLVLTRSVAERLSQLRVVVSQQRTLRRPRQ
jgi:hypothetical protein